MRRISIIIALVLAFLFSTQSIYGQTKINRFDLYVGGGAGLGLGDLADRTDAGFFGQIGIGYRPAPVTSPQVTFVTRFQYTKFAAAQTGNYDYIFTMAGLDIKLDSVFSKKPNLYFLGGAGYARTDDGRGVENNPYITAAWGLEAGWFVLEARVTNIIGGAIKNLTFLPVNVGLKF